MAESVRSCKKRPKSNYHREIARHAAKDRRDKENEIFAELYAAIPATNGSNVTHIDRIALLRLAVALIRLRGCAQTLMKTVLDNTEEEYPWSEDIITSCLDGFILICDSDGVVLYSTESVAKYVGLNQTDLVGRKLRDFVDRKDYEELREAAVQQEATGEGQLIFMHIKSVTGPQGRKLSLKSPYMKPVKFCLRILYDSNTKQRLWLLLATTAPIGSGSLYKEVANHYSANSTFVTRHTCDMKFSYVDESLKSYLKLEPETLIGTSFYNLVHPEDLLHLVKSLKILFKKMHCRTPYYRLMGGCGTLLWVQTEAGAVSNTSRGQRNQYIICIHQILGAQNDAESNSVTANAIISAKTNATINDLQDDCFDLQSQSIKCRENISPHCQNGNWQQKQHSGGVQSARVSRRMDSFNEVLQWLKSDLPDNLPSDLDTTPALAADAPYSKRQSQRSLTQQQDSQLAVCNEITSIACLPEVDAMIISSSYTGKDNLLPQSPIKNDVNNIQFDHLTITSPSQHLDKDGFLHGNSIYAYPQVSTMLSSTMGSLSRDNATEMLETLAPFVAQEEMLPLDMQGLTADFYMDEWFQSELATTASADRLLITPPPLANTAF
uniref:Uncharacterized protein n=1 Tax=Plectus sambesii TaxID=2011161 RepID=A0A914VBL0_9BILA